MAKSNFPMMKSGGGVLSKVVGLLLLVVIGSLVVNYPADSANWAIGIVHSVGRVIDGLVSFFRTLSR